MRVLCAALVAACGGGAASKPAAPPPSSPPAATDPDPLVDADLQPPAPELARDAAHLLAVPPLPAFDLPAPNPDGSLSVRALRIAHARLLDRDMTVKGVITWVYDCVADIRKPKESDKAVKKRIEDDPTLCQRAKFYVGDSATTPREKSLWVVDVPRAYNKLELTRLKKADRTMPDRCEPGDTAVCIPHKVGDQVLVTGTFAQRSPHSETNSDGLLIYKRMNNLTQKRETVGGGPVVGVPLTSPAPIQVTATPPARSTTAKVRRSARVASLDAAEAGTRAYAQRQLDTAIDAYQRATAAWHDNHRAWYGLAASYSVRNEWAKAAEAAQVAVELAPDAAMYQLMYARTLYRKAIDGVTDRATVNFDKVQAHAAAALALEPALWRAHALLGQTLRYSGRAKQAAEELSRAIAFAPEDPEPWVALAELYRQWDYTDQAIQVALQATTIVNHPDAALELGLAYEDKRDDAAAIAAYTKAFDAGSWQALFSRGHIFYLQRKYPEARRDLEQYLQRAEDAFLKQEAQHILMSIP